MKFSNDSGHLAEGDSGAVGFNETEAKLAKAIRDSVNVYCNALKIPDSSPPYYYDTVERLNWDPYITHKISIHINSSGPKSTGLLALVNEQGRIYGENLILSMSKYTGLRVIEVKYYYDNWVSGVQRYTREFDYAKIPLALLECGFISNQNEIPLIKNSYLMAKGIIHTYIQMYYNCYKITWFKIGSTKAIDTYKPITLKAAPIVRNSRTLIGLNDLSQLFAVSIKWNPNTKTITLEGNKTSILKIGTNIATVDSKYLKLNVVPVIINSRTYIGLSDLPALFGGVIFYVPETKEIVLLRY